MSKGSIRLFSAALALGMPLGVGAASAAPTADRAAPVTIATGLNNPRQLSFSGAALYVAESGVGGSGPCIQGSEGQACFGRTGAITKIVGTTATRVVTGLPSIAGAGGFGASGPSDVQVSAGTYRISLGLGADPALRAGLPAAGPRLGTIATGRLGSAMATTVADLAAYEGAKDPAADGPDSNPSALGPMNLTVDAGANALLRASARGKMAVVATFPSRMVPKPPFLGEGEMPMQSVPTSVAVGPDGAYYVSELTGFPFPAGGARIWRVVPGQTPRVYATGLTNVTDLAWAGNRLYAVQIADGGLLSVPEGELPMGSLVEVRRSGPRTVAANLTAPYGVAVKGANTYVTTCGMCAGMGAVVRIPLAGS